MRKRAPAIVARHRPRRRAFGVRSSKAPGVQPAPSGGATAGLRADARRPRRAAASPDQADGDAVPKDPHQAAGHQGPDHRHRPGRHCRADGHRQLRRRAVQDGKEFDSSWKRNQPFSTALGAGSVIPGWVKGIPGMKVGGRRELIIPPTSRTGRPAARRRSRLTRRSSSWSICSSRRLDRASAGSSARPAGPIQRHRLADALQAVASGERPVERLPGRVVDLLVHSTLPGRAMPGDAAGEVHRVAVEVARALKGRAECHPGAERGQVGLLRRPPRAQRGRDQRRRARG